MADVVGVLAALGLGCREGLVAGLALGQPAEEIGAGRPAGMDALGRSGLQQVGDLPEPALGDECGVSLLHAHGRLAVLGADSPDDCSGVGFVAESGVDRALEPLLALGGGDSLCVECLGDVEGAHALQGHVEHALDHRVLGRVRLQLRARLSSVLHVDLPVAEGCVGAHPEATRGGLAHPPADLLRKIFTIELIDAFDYRLHELAGWRVVGVLCDGDYADALSPEHGLECDGVLSLSGEAGEFPDEDFLERSLRLGGGVQHPAELRPVGDASALGLVDVLTHDHVAVLVGVVSERPQLCGDRQIHVLPVAGHPGVERRRRVVVLYLHIHPIVLLLASSASRSFNFSYLIVASHSRSCM